MRNLKEYTADDFFKILPFTSEYDDLKEEIKSEERLIKVKVESLTEKQLETILENIKREIENMDLPYNFQKYFEKIYEQYIYEYATSSYDLDDNLKEVWDIIEDKYLKKDAHSDLAYDEAKFYDKFDRYEINKEISIMTRKYHSFTEFFIYKIKRIDIKLLRDYFLVGDDIEYLDEILDDYGKFYVFYWGLSVCILCLIRDILFNEDFGIDNDDLISGNEEII